MKLKYAFITLSTCNSITIRIKKPAHEKISFSLYKQNLLYLRTEPFEGNELCISNLPSDETFRIIYTTSTRENQVSANLQHVTTLPVPSLSSNDVQYDHCGLYITHFRVLCPSVEHNEQMIIKCNGNVVQYDSRVNVQKSSNIRVEVCIEKTTLTYDRA